MEAVVLAYRILCPRVASAYLGLLIASALPIWQNLENVVGRLVNDHRFIDVLRFIDGRYVTTTVLRINLIMGIFKIPRFDLALTLQQKVLTSSLCAETGVSVDLCGAPCSTNLGLLVLGATCP